MRRLSVAKRSLSIGSVGFRGGAVLSGMRISEAMNSPEVNAMANISISALTFNAGVMSPTSAGETAQSSQDEQNFSGDFLVSDLPSIASAS